MTVDKERAAHIVADISRYMTDILAMKKAGINLEDKRDFYSLSMLLFSLTNRAIDLGEEIVSGHSLGVPSSYRDVFELLFKSKFIDSAMLRKMKTLVYYRNLLSHEYHDFTPSDIRLIMRGTLVIESFVTLMKKKM